MNLTKIEWATLTWNPWSGCVPISAGCKNCYAKTRAERLAGGKAFPHGFKLTLRGRSTMLEPLTKLAPARVFVNSMTDLFWDQVTDEMIGRESTPDGEIGSLSYPLVWVTGWQYPTRKWWFRLWGEPGGWGPLCPSVLPSRQAAIRAGLLALADREEARAKELVDLGAGLPFRTGLL